MPQFPPSRTPVASAVVTDSDFAGTSINAQIPPNGLLSDGVLAADGFAFVEFCAFQGVDNGALVSF